MLYGRSLGADGRGVGPAGRALGADGRALGAPIHSVTYQTLPITK